MGNKIVFMPGTIKPPLTKEKMEWVIEDKFNYDVRKKVEQYINQTGNGKPDNSDGTK